MSNLFVIKAIHWEAESNWDGFSPYKSSFEKNYNLVIINLKKDYKSLKYFFNHFYKNIEFEKSHFDMLINNGKLAYLNSNNTNGILFFLKKEECYIF